MLFRELSARFVDAVGEAYFNLRRRARREIVVASSSNRPLSDGLFYSSWETRMFTPNTIASTVEAAKKHGVEPAALLAVVEIESAGKAFEADGCTPRFLFERHVFHRELKKHAPQKLEHAVREGLAIPQWSRGTQYRDLATSAGRMSLLARARAVDTECANRSASWGVGQTMGFHAARLGFASATAMVEHMRAGGLAAQVDVMCRNISDMRLWNALKARDFTAFARRYNGAGYRQNAYDTRMAAAYRRWVVQLGQVTPAKRTTKPAAAKAGAVVAGAGGAAAAAAQTGWSAGAVIAVALAAVLVVAAGAAVLAVARRRTAERPVIPVNPR
jgi:N-acetylmuramidase